MRAHPACCRSCFLLLLLASGCESSPRADYSGLGLVEVNGRVTLDGIALSGARIEFESPNATRSTATTDAHGRYRLMFDSDMPGCLPGEKIVRIRMPSASAEIENPDAAPASGVVIPLRYNAESQLAANVSAQQKTFDFDLFSGDADATTAGATSGP
jgi:hypothetical protein